MKSALIAACIAACLTATPAFADDPLTSGLMPTLDLSLHFGGDRTRAPLRFDAQFAGVFELGLTRGGVDRARVLGQDLKALDRLNATSGSSTGYNWWLIGGGALLATGIIAAAAGGAAHEDDANQCEINVISNRPSNTSGCQNNRTGP